MFGSNFIATPVCHSILNISKHPLSLRCVCGVNVARVQVSRAVGTSKVEVVLAVEVGGRWSEETVTFLSLLAKAKA